MILSICTYSLTFAYSADNSSIKLFGKMALKGRISSLPTWVEVLSKHSKTDVFRDDFKLNATTTWGDFKAYLLTLSPKEQLKQVNLFWNKWPYRQDPEVYKVPDYWAAPYEFQKNSGDCEDYSIAKYFTLKMIGYDIEDMRIVIVRETTRNIAHAVLAVYLDGDAYILDNLNNSILSHSTYKNYDAQYSVNEEFRWGYVKPKD